MYTTLWGIHARNGNDNLVGEALEVSPSHVTILHLQGDHARELHDRIDGYLHVRMYLSKWSKWMPEDWAVACVEAANRDRGGWSLLSLPRVLFSPANEQNLSVEGGGDDLGWYTVIDDWNYRWSVEFRRLTGCPKERLMWPALAYGHGEEVGYAECKRSLAEYGMVGCHPYWYQPDQVCSEYYGHRFVLDHAATGLPIFISEAGNFRITDPNTPNEYIEWFESLYQYEYVLGATPFIRSSPDPGHASNDWSKNPELIRRVREQSKRKVERSLHTNEGGTTMAYAVGPGILAKMAEQNDEPASDEWYPRPEWALAFGKSGNQYVYLKETNVTSVFCPKA